MNLQEANMKNSTAIINKMISRIEDDPDTRTLLVSIGSYSLDFLVEALPNASKAQTWHILNTISRIGEPRVAIAVEELLQSPHKAIQIAAIQCLESLANEHSIEALMNLLLSNHSEHLHIWIVHALGQLKAADSVPYLMSILETTQSTVVQYTTIEALQLIGDPVAIQTIVRYADSENHHVRSYSENALKHFSSHGYR